MLFSGYVKLKYRHVAFRYWPLSHVEFNLHMMATYLLIYIVRWLTLCIMLGMTTRKNQWFEKWNGKILNHA
jgi:hypothetical protein